MPTVIPPAVLAEFDQIHQCNLNSLNKLVEAHRDFCTDEQSRIAAILGQVEVARLSPEAAFHLLAVAIDELAKR